jgi:hypothetical protein
MHDLYPTSDPYRAMYGEVLDEMDEINNHNASFCDDYLEDEREEDTRMGAEEAEAEVEVENVYVHADRE